MPSGGPGVWGTGRPLPRERRTQRQQLGRAMDRDWAGSTGRTGWSNAGKRLANFFIGRLLIASNHHRNSRQTSSRASVADRPAKSRQTVLHDVPSWIWPSRLATCTAVQPGHLAQLAPHLLSRQTVLCERRTYPTESRPTLLGNVLWPYVTMTGRHLCIGMCRNYSRLTKLYMCRDFGYCRINQQSLSWPCLHQPVPAPAAAPQPECPSLRMAQTPHIARRRGIAPGISLWLELSEKPQGVTAAGIPAFEGRGRVGRKETATAVRMALALR
jgi:hypothetical protein